MVPARIDRKTYGLWCLFYLAVYGGAYWVHSKGLDDRLASLVVTVAPFGWMVFLGAPRLRDIGWSGWFAAVPFLTGFAIALFHPVIPGDVLTILRGLLGLASLMLIVVLALIPGQAGENRYGRPPGAAPPDPEVFS